MSDSKTTTVDLPRDLRLRILSLLSPNELALAGRLTCKDAAHHFSEAHHCTVHFDQPLPPIAAAALELEMRQWTLRNKLQLLVTSPKCGIEQNVELVWKVLQPQLLPELLQTNYYLDNLRLFKIDMGSTAVAAGLAHLLPTLERRCPGLLDPCRTLEAAARHCDLAGLRAAWEVVGQRLQSSRVSDDDEEGAPELCGDPGFWSEVLGAAASSAATADAVAKMEWALRTGRLSNERVVRDSVLAAVVASGELARLQWLREYGFSWGTGEVLGAVLQYADMHFILQLEQEGGYLPTDGDIVGVRGALQWAAGAPRDSGAKVRWLVSKGVPLPGPREVADSDAVLAAARHGNLEALQLLMGPALAHNPGDMHVLGGVLRAAVGSRSVPTAAWLHGVGCPLDQMMTMTACEQGDLAMLRWLLEVRCPNMGLSIPDVLTMWPSRTAKDGYRLAEAVRLVSQAGWPILEEAEDAYEVHPLEAALMDKHPGPVWRTLRELLPPGGSELLPEEAARAAGTGCEAIVEDLVRMGVVEEYGSRLTAAWYAGAAKNGDVGTLAVLQRLGVLPGQGTLKAAVEEGAPVCALELLVQHGALLGEQEVQSALGGFYKIVYAGEAPKVEAWLRGLLQLPAAAGRGEPQHSAGGELGAGRARGGSQGARAELVGPRPGVGSGLEPGGGVAMQVGHGSEVGAELGAGTAARHGGRLLGLWLWLGLAVLLAAVVLVQLGPSIMYRWERLWM